jgi:hypothetical protein
MMQKLVLAVTVVMLSLSVLGLGAHAQSEATPQKSDLPLLVLGGSLGALGGGLAGMEGLHFLCHRLPGIGWNDITCAFFGLFGYLAGVPAGATVGVGITGSIRKAPGGLWSALLGATAGEGAAVGVVVLLSALVSNNPSLQWLQNALVPLFTYIAIPVSAGLGAAWGYNRDEMSRQSKLIPKAGSS